MHIIVGLILVLALGYYWLLGHWYARAVMFILFAAVFGFIGWAGGMELRANGISSEGGGAAILGVLGGIALAWPVASLPIYRVRRAGAAWEVRKAELLCTSLARAAEIRADWNQRSWIEKLRGKLPESATEWRRRDMPHGA